MPEDLARGKIVSIKHSVSDRYLRERRTRPLYCGGVTEGLRAIKEKKADAMVYDAPLLQYTIRQHFPEALMTVGALFEMQNYGIAFPEGSALRERVNRALLDILHSEAWEKTRRTYLGE